LLLLLLLPCRLGLGLELQGDVEASMWHISQLYSDYAKHGQPVPEQLKRDMERIATTLQQQRHPGLAAAERDVDSTSTASTLKASADQQQPAAPTAPAAVPAAAAAACVPAFTGMRSSIPIKFESESEEESEEESASSCPADNGNAATAATVGSSSEQHDAAAAACESGITKIAFEMGDSSSGEEEDAAQEQHSSAASAAATAATAAAAVFQQPHSKASTGDFEDDEELLAAAAAAAAAQQGEAAADLVAAVEQQPQSSLHQRSRSAGQGSTAGNDAWDEALKKFMEVTDMRRDQQQKLGSSNASSSGSSSGSSSSSSFDDLAAAQQQREASTAQQLTEIQRLAQLWKQQHEQQARQQHWKDVRQQWWERLQQQHPQAVAEVNKLRQVAQEIETELINTLKAGGSSSSTASERKPSETYYQRRDNAAAAREAGDQALKQSNANAALKHYNAAVAKLQIDPRSYVGRAQVWLRLRRPQHAEQDCGVALLLATAPEVSLRLGQPQEADGAVDVAFVARVRRVRAAAWKEMGKLKEAVAVSISMASAVCVVCVGYDAVNTFARKGIGECICVCL
jgi:hypothetical protein